MNALATDLRRTLEKSVVAARDLAEAAAARAVDRLGVGLAKKPDYLSSAEEALRRRLRQRGRALGDVLRGDGSQETDALVREAAYEHWHRLLFARFLLEADLLTHPEYGVSVGMAECEALAREETRETGQRTDAFEIAARFAAGMLPQIFRTDDAVLDLRFAPEDRKDLRDLVLGLGPATFQADDALGWVYQFWQTKRKDEVNASGVKIGADELPAVTQLFTEDYMVRFLLENTLGAWWVDRTGTEPPTAMPYLRRLDDGTPAAGGFPGWPDRVADLRVIDPSMGSGHFLVAALAILVPMRMAEEGIDAQTAVDRVLAENLHGLELDARCTQIAAFALALAAWTTPDAGGYRELPPMRLACSGLAPSGTLDEWTALADAAAETDGDRERLRNGMRRLWALFQDAPTLGSLIDPGQVEDPLLTAAPADLAPLLTEALGGDGADEESGVVARGIAEAADLLGKRYHLVATNVPYLKRGNQGETLKAFADRHYPEGKADLATVFVQRSLGLCAPGGATALVTPRNWLFLTSYRTLRESLLKRQTWTFYAPLGVGAFETISGEVVNVALPILNRAVPTGGHHLAGVDASAPPHPREKAELLRRGAIRRVQQASQLENPDARVSLSEAAIGKLLSKFASSTQGLTTGDNPRYVRAFWELAEHDGRRRFQGSADAPHPYEGRRWSVYFEEGITYALPQSGGKLNGSNAWGNKGVMVNQMGSLDASLFDGEMYSMNAAAIVPHDKAHLPAVWAFCSSEDFYHSVRRIDKAIKVTNATLVKVPFDLERWQKVADEQYPDGLPEPYSDDPTQWLFHGHPAHAEDPSSKAAAPLHVAVARLVGYRWPTERDDDMELAAAARQRVAEAARLDGHSDEDGIVCLPAVARERPAADRLLDLLRDAYGDRWSAGLQQRLLEQEGVKKGGLEKWLRAKFFANHCALFGWRPFVWHVTDGHSEGFSALVNYHALDRAGLERLVYTYLGDWISRQRQAAGEGVEGAAGRLEAAEDLSRRLKLVLEGEPPYDVFVRWKPAHEQPIGWDPDLNDGVLLNIWPFLEAGVLNLTNSQAKRFKYTKDRGKNPPGEPWGPERHNRYEDVRDEYKLKDEAGKPAPHLTNDVKRAARTAAEEAEAQALASGVTDDAPRADA